MSALNETSKRVRPAEAAGGGDKASAVERADADLLRVAFQIHNGPAQCLATALALFRALDRQLPSEMVEARKSLQATIASTQAALESTRRAIGGLRSPSNRRSAGTLAEYLRDAFEEVRSQTVAELSLDVDPVDDLPSGTATGLAEVGREALVNAARHASARHIAVTVRRTRHSVVLEVRDDGSGFGGRAGRSGARRGGGFGLALMHDQMRLLGGTLHIRRVPAEGTVVRASLPLAEAVSSGRRSRRPATAS